MKATAQPKACGTGISDLDRLLGGGLSDGALVGLIAPAGSGKRVFAAEFLLAPPLNGSGGALFWDLLGSDEGLPPGLEDRRRQAHESGRLRRLEVAPEDLEPEALLASLTKALEKPVSRLAIAGADMLARLGDPILPLKLYRLLRKRHVTTYLLFSELSGDAPPRHQYTPELIEPLSYLFRCFFDFDEEGNRRHRFAIERAIPPSLAPPLQSYRIASEGIVWGQQGTGGAAPGAYRAPTPTIATFSVPELTVIPELYYRNQQSERIVHRQLRELNRESDRWSLRPHPQRIQNSLQYNRLFEAFKAGEHVADLMVVDIYRLRECIELGLIHPLDDFVDSGWEEQFLPVALDQCRINGSLWAIPHWTNAGVMIYREDLLRRHGMKPPTTFDALVDACHYLLRKTRQPGLEGFGFAGAVAEALSCNFLEFLWNSGGDVFDEDGSPALQSTPARAALERMVHLIHDSRVSPAGTASMTESDATRAFRDGNLLFLRSWPNHLTPAGTEPGARQAAASLAPLPLDGPGSARGVIGGFCYVVPRTTADPEILLRFHREFHSPEIVREMAIHGWTCPPFRSVYQDAKILHHRPYYRNMPQLLANGRSRGSIPYYHRLTGPLREYVNKALTRERSPEESLQLVARAFSRYTTRQHEANRLRDALDFIRSNLHLDFSREDVARRCGVNPTYFSTLFRELTGTTFSRYVNQQRIRQARKLLETSEQPIAEIARKVGFSDASYFSLVFRDHTKMTPGRFRENARARTFHH